MGKLSEKRSRKFRIEPFLKGLQVSKGQSPLLALKTDIHTFSRLIKRPCPHCSAQRNPKYDLKRKSVFFGSAFQRGALSCRAPRTPRRAHCVSVQSRESVKISDALGVRAPFEKGAPKLFLTLSGGDFGKI